MRPTTARTTGFGYRVGRSLLALSVAGGLLLGTFVAQAQLFGASEREINRQARLQWMMTKREMPISLEQHLNDFVYCVTNRVIAHLPPEFDDIDWEIVVFEDDALNAFALPGGRIGVFTGLLRVATNQDMLATVIGHEIAHVTEDHVIQRARRAGRNDALGILAGAATGMHPSYIEMGKMMGMNLPYARGQEIEADVVGLQFMANAGFDPRASIELWRAMVADRDSRRRESMLLASHPSDDQRMNQLVRSMTPALIAYNDALESVGRPNCQLRR